MFHDNVLLEIARGIVPKITRQHRTAWKPRLQVQYGDAAYVLDGGSKRFGIWTGTSFVQYAKDCIGVRRVHEVSLHDFLNGAVKLYVCRFPRRYGRPEELQIPLCGVVMPTDKYLLYLLERKYKQATYHLYSPEQTVRRARSCLGKDDFATSEDFILWCRTGIKERNGLYTLRKTLERIITYWGMRH